MREASVSADSKGLTGALTPLLCITFERGGVCCNLRCNWAGAEGGMGSTDGHRGTHMGKANGGEFRAARGSGWGMINTEQGSRWVLYCQF